MEGQNNTVIILLNDKSVKYSGMYRTLSEPYQEYETTDKYCWTCSVVTKNRELTLTLDLK